MAKGRIRARVRTLHGLANDVSRFLSVDIAVSLSDRSNVVKLVRFLPLRAGER